MKDKHPINVNCYHLPVQLIAKQGRDVNKVSLPRGAPEAEILGERKTNNVLDWDPRNRAGEREAEVKLQWQKVVIFRPSELGDLNFTETGMIPCHKCLMPNVSKLERNS